MTSQINPTTINESFPVPGMDNNSQGFRDNFASIKNSLQTAKSEITALQNNGVLRASLTNNQPVVNNLFSSTLHNGQCYNVNSTVYSAINTRTDVTIDVQQADIFDYTLANNVGFTFDNWPEAGLYRKIQLHLKSNGQSAFVPTLANARGKLIYSSTFPDLSLTYTVQTVPITASDADTDTFTLGSTENLYTPLPIRFSAIAPNQVFGGVAVDTDYYIHNIVSSTQFQIATTLTNGITTDPMSLVTATGTMTGTVYYAKSIILEIWTTNGGLTAYVNYLGDY